MARIVRGQTKALRKQTFIDAAIVGGVPTRRILGRHILPNLLSPIIVFTTLTIPAVILLESVISFLGLGVQPPMSSWGMLINEGAVARYLPVDADLPCTVFLADYPRVQLRGRRTP